MIHLDPDFKSLSEDQRTVALKCLYGLTRHANEERTSGLTQIHLIHAIGTALLGVDLNVQDAAVDQDSLNALAQEFKGISTLRLITTNQHLFARIHNLSNVALFGTMTEEN